MIVHQYWHDKQIPEWLQACHASVRRWHHDVRVYNQGDYIELLHNNGVEPTEAFKSRLKHSVQADVFRTMILAKEGGIWLDMDVVLFNSLSRLAQPPSTKLACAVWEDGTADNYAIQAGSIEIACMWRDLVIEGLLKGIKEVEQKTFDDRPPFNHTLTGPVPLVEMQKKGAIFPWLETQTIGGLALRNKWHQPIKGDYWIEYFRKLKGVHIGYSANKDRFEGQTRLQIMSGDTYLSHVLHMGLHEWNF